MTFFEDLNNFIIGTTIERTLPHFLIFVLACMIISLIVIIVDYAYDTLSGKTVLNLNYKNKDKIKGLVGAYVSGAGGVGFLGLILNFLNLNIMGAAAAGISWPLIFPRLVIAAVKKVNIEEEPKQPINQGGD
jgi:hypothetical protein